MRVRPLLGVLAAVAVVGFLVLLSLYVSVTSRFDGRLWQIPSRVYSDALTLSPGDEISVPELERRLQRSGYARTEGEPARPGQYRRAARFFEVFVREFWSPQVASDARRVRLRFLGGRVRSIEDARGRPVRRAVLEPELLATLYGPRQEERRPLRLEEIPEPFIESVLAAEDARFSSHHGVDVRGILRAAWVNLRRGRIVQGGSTITQQTVKNLYLDQERTWWRKLREAAMAVLLDARYSKRRILEVYLNEVYLGQSGTVAICGAEAAARFYFGRSLGDLSLGEWSLLAGMIRSPGTYNPFVHPDRALERRRDVLEAMQRLGLLEPERVEEVAAQPLHLGSGGLGFGRAPYAVDFVQSRLAELYPRAVLEAEGLNIYTSLDTRVQERAEKALERGLLRLERDVPALARRAGTHELQGAVIVTRPDNGAILALVGGRDYRRTQFNRAVQARRQPGSCFKPLVYAAGFERAVRGEGGLTPATVLEDSPLELVSGGRRWSPANYDRTYRGAVTVRQALEESLNVPTVRAAREVGLERIVATARSCGIRSPLSPLPSLALGTEEVTPLELATVYGVFANEGTRVTPWIIRAVTDAEGGRLEGRGLERARAVSPETAFLVRDLLYGVFERGTARSAPRYGFERRAAGKTGTTDDTRDAWFVGFSGGTLALVWVGYDDNARTGLTGATGALPVWADLMRGLPLDRELPPAPPAGIVTRTVDLATGELAASGCTDTAREYFVRGTEPTRECHLHQGRFRRWLRRFLGSRGRAGRPGA